MVPVMVLAALLVSLSLVGLPWRSSPVMGNFSGRLVYTTNDGTLDLSGCFSLLPVDRELEDVSVKMFVDGKEYTMKVLESDNTFSGVVDLNRSLPESVEARLEVDGKIIASSTISLPRAGTPHVHIIRFSSLS